MSTTRRVFLGGMAGFAAAHVLAQDQPIGGHGKLYVGGRPSLILILDEASGKPVGEIKTRTGTPARLTLSTDRTRIYAISSTLEDMEVIDLASSQVIDNFRLGESGKHVRFRGFAIDPSHRYAVMATKAATKQIDRWEIGPPLLLQYDMKDHKVVRTIPWPNGEERESAGLKFSPDGKYLYIFGGDIVAFDTTDFKEVDKWELSRPLEEGFGRIDFGYLDDTYEEPGYYSGLFHVRDAVQHREIMGIARVDLQQKQVDFYALGPAEDVSFAMAPGRELAYGVRDEVGHFEFWTFDLKNRRVVSRTPFDGRPRMAMKTSTNGKLLYVYQAGNTIDVYDAASYRFLRTIQLDIDMTGFVIVPPAA